MVGRIRKKSNLRSRKGSKRKKNLRIKSLKDLFQNPNFRVFAPYFLERPRTVTEVYSEVSGKIKSRATIYNLGKPIDKYFVSTGRSESGFADLKRPKKVPYQLGMNLLAYYFAEVVPLEEKERDILADIISDPNIKNFIVKDNKSIDAIISNMILVVLAIDVLEKRDLSAVVISKRMEAESKGNRNSSNVSDFYDKLKLLVDVITQITPTMMNKDEITAFGEAAIKFADKKSPELNALTKKIRQYKDNDLSFNVRPNGLYNILYQLLSNQSWFNDKVLK